MPKTLSLQCRGSRTPLARRSYPTTALVAVLCFSSSIFAASDQSNDPGNQLFGLGHESLAWRQGVTANANGLLTSVDLYFDVLTSPGNFVLSISSGSPSGTSSPEYTILKQVNAGLNTFDVSAASLYLKPNTQFTIGARGLGTQGNDPYLIGTNANNYLAGELWLNEAPYVHPSPSQVYDMAFRTHVDSEAGYAMPRPSPLLLTNMIRGQPVADYVRAPISSTLPNFSANSFVSTDGTRIVLAIPGTDSLADWFGPNLTWLAQNGQANAALTAYVNEAALMLRALRIMHPNAKVTLTGHSLGGAVAQILGEVGGFSTTAFNAPGVKDAVVPFVGNLNVGPPITDSHEIVNYRVYGDLVSTVGHALNSARTLTLVAPSNVQQLIQTSPEGAAAAAVAVHLLSTVEERLANDATILLASGPTAVELAGMYARNTLVTTVPGGVLWTATATVTAGHTIFIDPTSLDLYELTLAPSSPAVQAIVFPILLDSVGSFRLESEVNGAWTTIGTFAELAQFTFGPFGSRQLRFFILNGNSDLPPPSIEEFAFGVKFVEDGIFEGRIFASSTATSVPEPSSLLLFIAGAAVVTHRSRYTRRRSG